MPTEAFFHLEEQKKMVLLESAVSEFSALPYEKVSIFKIAQNAGVSRSGFYYYFKDKEDIYKYLIDQIKEEFMTELGKDKRRYDIFAFCKKNLLSAGQCERNQPGSTDQAHRFQCQTGRCKRIPG